jgi:hypothetical protein
MLYIQDRGVSRWDTCAAEGVLEAHGGRLTKLTAYLAAPGGGGGGATTDDGEEERRRLGTTGGDGGDNGEFYRYLAGPTNLDFVPGLACLTKNNRRRRSAGGDGDVALDVGDVNAYSNLCGFVALGREWNTAEGRTYIGEAIRRAALLNPPSFN